MKMGPWDHVPRRKLIMPSMPAIPSTLCVPKSFPSCSLKSPEGRSTTNEGAEGFEGEEKAYWEGDAWTLMSRKGWDAAIVGRRRLAVRRGRCFRSRPTIPGSCVCTRTFCLAVGDCDVRSSDGGGALCFRSVGDGPNFPSNVAASTSPSLIQPRQHQLSVAITTLWHHPSPAWILAPIPAR